jgi:phage FluMu protein Com
MTRDDINNREFQCPRCKASITVAELGEHVNSNPEIKKQAIAEQLEQWGEEYDLEYLMQNVVFCPRCHKVSHFKDWSSGNK